MGMDVKSTGTIGDAYNSHTRVVLCLLYDAGGQNYFRSHFFFVKNEKKLHSANTSYATKVVEKQQILIVKTLTFKFKIGVLWATIAQKQQISGDFIQPITSCSD
jgi:hypothetical protein